MIYKVLDNIVRNVVKKINLIFNCYDLAIYKESIVDFFFYNTMT